VGGLVASCVDLFVVVGVDHSIIYSVPKESAGNRVGSYQQVLGASQPEKILPEVRNLAVRDSEVLT
jgi:hypothetical protein